MKRRDLLRFPVCTAVLGGLSTQLLGQQGSGADGAPAQFVPRNPRDPKPHENDIVKYPKCPYCGMDRKQFHHSRLLVHYSDDLPDATCSLHCAAISLAINVDREPKAIWVGDNASAAETKPLVDAGKASFLVGSRIAGVMSRRSKVAYASAEAANAARTANGGDVMDFDKALLAAYTDMAEDVSMIRKNREERRKRMQQGA
jgi:copper chaperone NosL